MSFLAIARGVVTGYERNERNELSPSPSEQDVEMLQARIIEAVTVESDQFDRAHYLRLWTLWKAQDARKEESRP